MIFSVTLGARKRVRGRWVTYPPPHGLRGANSQNGGLSDG